MKTTTQQQESRSIYSNDEEPSPSFLPFTCVTIVGLTSDKGKLLNGRSGTVEKQCQDTLALNQLTPEVILRAARKTIKKKYPPSLDSNPLFCVLALEEDADVITRMFSGRSQMHHDSIVAKVKSVQEKQNLSHDEFWNTYFILMAGTFVFPEKQNDGLMIGQIQLAHVEGFVA